MKAYIVILLLSFLFLQCSKEKHVTSVSALPLTKVGLSVPEGQLMVVNAPDVHYTFLIEGTDLHNTQRTTPEDPMALLSDGVFIQMTSLPISSFLKGDPSRYSDEALLTLHQTYEAAYLGSTIEQEHKIEQEILKLPNGRECMIWMMRVEGLPAQVLMTTVVSSHVLLLSSPLIDGGKTEEERILTKLMGAMESIELKSEPIDILHLQDSVFALTEAVKDPSTGVDRR